MKSKIVAPAAWNVNKVLATSDVSKNYNNGKATAVVRMRGI